MRIVMALALVLCAQVALAKDFEEALHERGAFHAVPLDWQSQIEPLKHALISLPIAAALGAALAFRPRRRGTPPRTPAVIQTQIMLALVGALVMLVVGSSLARAFGIVGAASLVRYRAKIDDPKDAGVMLCSLALGLASGVGLFVLAGFGMLVIMGVLWMVESLEPTWHRLFNLKITTKEPLELKARVEELLLRAHIRYELRSTTNEELSYEVKLPYERRTDRISTAILELDPANSTAVEWEEKKNKQPVE